MRRVGSGLEGLPPSPSSSRTRYSVQQIPTTSTSSPIRSDHSDSQRPSPVPSETEVAWKRDLYLLQEKAPRPVAVVNERSLGGRVPAFYGREFHGMLGREEAAELLLAFGEGAYLVRESQRAPGSFTLCLVFDGRVLNYRLYYDGAHYVGEKRFDTMEDLVWDGLISMFVSKHAGEYIAKMSEEAVYEESPYSQYQRMATMGRRGGEARVKELHLHPDEDDALTASEELWTETDKPHRFKAQTFRVASYCDLCRNFMWGLVQQGLRCEDCGFAAHKKCSELCRPDCRPQLRYVKRIFGVELSTLCMAHGCLVPPLLEHCVKEIEQRGLLVEGIYRVSGAHDEVAKLRSLYDTQAHRPQWLAAKLSRVEDIHTIASLHKLFLRLLPLPLIPVPVAQSLLQALRVADGVGAARESLASSQLSPAHSATLRLLLRHLAAVAAKAHFNKMTAENLARVFAPTLLCAASPQTGAAQSSLPLLCSAHNDHQLLHFLITNQHSLF